MKKKKYFLSKEASLKWLETQCVYNIRSDDLYEVDESGFHFLKECANSKGCFSSDSEFLDFCIKEGLLSERMSGEKKIPERRSLIPSLRYLELQITDRCNLKCRHCYIGKRSQSELNLEKTGRIMQEFEEMQGLRLLITGGEPLMYAEFDSLNALLEDFEFRKVLFTNGLLLNVDVLRELKVDEIQISIDGLEQSHDYIRGGGTYERSMKAIKLAIDSGFEVSVSTMIHSMNLDDFEKMEGMFKGLGIKDWTVDVPCLSGYLRENRDLLPSPDVAGRYLKYGFGEGLHGGGEGYVCGLHLMSVMPDGSAAKCAFYSDQPVGHIDEGLEACWRKVEHPRLDDIECDCSFIDICRGGCRYRALLEGGSRSKDPYRCTAFLGSNDMTDK